MKPARSVYSGSWTACAPRITLGRASGDLESDMRVVWWYWLYLPSWGQQKHRDLIPLYRQPEGSKVSPEAFDAQTAYEYTGPSPDTILHATWSIVRSHRTAREDSSPRRSIATRSWHTTLDAAAGRLQGRAGCHGPDAGRRGKLGDEHGGNKGCGPISPLRICPPTLSTYRKNWETVSISDFRNYGLGVEYSRLTYVPRGLGKEWERQKKGRVLVSKFIVNADNENSAWFLLGICVENKDWMVETAIVQSRSMRRWGLHLFLARSHRMLPGVTVGETLLVNDPSRSFMWERSIKLILLNLINSWGWGRWGVGPQLRKFFRPHYISAPLHNSHSIRIYS